MYKRAVIPTVAFVVAAFVALIAYDVGVDVRRGNGLHWQPVLEGVVIGAPAALVVLLVRARLAAAVGLAAAALLFVGALAGLGMASGVIRSPVFWALVAALLVRLVLPGRSEAAAEERSRATAPQG